MDGGFDVLDDGGAALVFFRLMAVESADALRLHGPAPDLRRVHLVGEAPQPPSPVAAPPHHIPPPPV